MDTELSLLLDVWSNLVARTRFSHRKLAVPTHVVEYGSVLVAGASEEQVAAVEQRLGVRLPPSYRAFLRLSNGAYGGGVGLQRHDPVHGPIAPRALLPVDAIGYAAEQDPFLVDLAGESHEARPFGQTSLYQAPAGDEVAYLTPTTDGIQPDAKLGHPYWSLLIGRVDDPATLMLLNPMVVDADGEWELWVLQPEGALRYPSFALWLLASIEEHESRTSSVAEAQQWLKDPEAGVAHRLSVVRDIIGAERDLEWLTAQVEMGLLPGIEAYLQVWALGLLEWIDTQDGGDRFTTWVRRIIDDPLYGDVGVIDMVAASSARLLPTVGEIVARERTPDLRLLGRLPTDDLVALYQAAPDPILASYLEERAHPLVVEPARVELDELVPAADGYYWPQGRTVAAAGARFGTLSAGEIVAVGTRARLRPEQIARAMVRAGHADNAVDYLEAKRNHSDNVYLLYTMAEIDIPRAWEHLDRAAGYPERPTSLVALEAAARTHSPLLPARAADLLDGDELENLTALLALEIQPTDLAADTLLTAWNTTTNWRALRALGRRRDPRIVDDCLLLLFDPEPEVRQVAAEVVRDLRDPATIGAVVAALTGSESDELTVVLANTLVMLRVTSAASILARQAIKTNNAPLAELLTMWSADLTDQAAANRGGPSS